MTLATSPISDSTLDRILTLQLTIAWAGEGRCEPSRLGWWQTDVIDSTGGADLLARLLPRTQPWASLEAAREAARQTDAKARGATARPDQLLTLFHLGPELDQRLRERLAQLKRSGIAPAQALPELPNLHAAFDRESLEAQLRHTVEYRITPAGREMRESPPESRDLAVAHLAAALLPFADAWPMPYFRMVA
ncbi:BREX-6 system BrxE protein [Vulgatibacter incomptus]|uniref:BREX-6 system BrxE protein n=1 Tax=Vulgatibacter incomptus TaxID=1391653 RepID=A0A0K1PCS1_9BACT|nr:BREX-6 system BrxE protein [Vulgatibacter incomptus]AKU90919.1 hypothetical protein AKJ08_1306 [Vulgatibacter incomptus]